MSKRNIKVVEGSGFLARKFSKYASFLKKSNTNFICFNFFIFSFKTKKLHITKKLN